MYDAIVLAGGRGTRLAGADKPALDVGGASLLDRVLSAVAAAERIVVVGPPRPVARPVVWCQEQPAGGGPVAGIDAGLAHVAADTVAVVAADLPWIAPAVPNLLAGTRHADVAVLVDADGRRNYLAAAWRREALAGALTALGGTTGAAARTLFTDVAVIEVPDPAGWGADCDTWDDLDAARRRADREGIAP
ncbi:MAG: molybdopterin-guanine dinucleotide biosynthesis protein [Pseudonocardiales bacterium]|nr:molybdopterin-guanine dinucleotide biosynthesis protein [Pseudonocardiales bacterium]